MTTTLRRVLVLLAGLSGTMLPSMARLEAQSLINAAATVPTASPTGGGARNLAFGAITPVTGVTQTVAVPAAIGPLSATAYSGEFALGVAGASGVDYTLSLPTVLTSTVGGLTLPISFAGAQYGAACVIEGGSGCTLASFDPGAGTSQRFCRGYRGNGACMTNRVWAAGSTLRVFVGGAVSVPPTAVAATYTGVITMSIIQVY